MRRVGKSNAALKILQVDLPFSVSYVHILGIPNRQRMAVPYVTNG